MRWTRRHACTVACLLMLAGGPASSGALRVLFLGNSLTAGHDVPALVQAMARLQGVDLQYTALTPGGLRARGPLE